MVLSLVMLYQIVELGHGSPVIMLYAIILIFALPLIIIIFLYPVFGQSPSGATKSESFISIKTDRIKYPTGQLVSISGNVTNDTGKPTNTTLSIQILRNDDNVKNRPQIIYKTSIYAKGHFQMDFRNTNGEGKYNITAGLKDSKPLAWTLFETENPLTTQYTFVLFEVLFFGFLMFWILLIASKGKTHNTTTTNTTNTNTTIFEQGEVIRFICLSGIALSPILAFIFSDLEIGANSPVGLIIKNFVDEKNKPETVWMINLGGTSLNKYSDGIQIPLYVLVLGVAGGYLRYLYKALTHPSQDEEKNKYDSKFFLRQTIAEFSDIVLAPFLAIAVWFILSVSGTPNNFTSAVVSFSVGFITADIVSFIIKFTTSVLNLKSAERHH